MTPIAYLSGIDTVKDAVENILLGKFIRDTVFEEIIPTINMSSDELIKYSEQVFLRFKNPCIKHYLIKISLNSISKFKNRVLPSLLGYIDIYKTLPKRIIFSFACLLLFYKGIRRNEVFEIQEGYRIKEYFATKWDMFNSGKISLIELIRDTLSNEFFWDKDLSKIPNLVDEVNSYLTLILNYDIENILQKLSK